MVKSVGQVTGNRSMYGREKILLVQPLFWSSLSTYILYFSKVMLRQSLGRSENGETTVLSRVSLISTCTCVP